MKKRPKTWEDLINDAEEKYGKESNIANFWRETKENALKKKSQRFEEIYFDRPVAFRKGDK